MSLIRMSFSSVYVVAAFCAAATESDKRPVVLVRDFGEVVPGGALHQPEPVLELLAHLEDHVVHVAADQAFASACRRFSRASLSSRYALRPSSRPAPTDSGLIRPCRRSRREAEHQHAAVGAAHADQDLLHGVDAARRPARHVAPRGPRRRRCPRPEGPGAPLRPSKSARPPARPAMRDVRWSTRRCPRSRRRRTPPATRRSGSRWGRGRPGQWRPRLRAGSARRRSRRSYSMSAIRSLMPSVSVTCQRAERLRSSSASRLGLLQPGDHPGCAPGSSRARSSDRRDRRRFSVTESRSWLTGRRWSRSALPTISFAGGRQARGTRTRR